jgi:hypothetical protein
MVHLELHLYHPFVEGCTYTLQIPHSFEYLRQHIEVHHNDLLDSFMEGWSSLSDQMRSKFLVHETILRRQDRNIPRRSRRRTPQGIQKPHQPRGWISWINFILDEVATIPSGPVGVGGQPFVTNQMENIGSIFGLAKNSEGYQNVVGAHGDFLAKITVAERVVAACLYRARGEIWERIKRRIEKDGVGVLYSILINDSVLDAILRVQASEMPSGEEAEA